MRKVIVVIISCAVLISSNMITADLTEEQERLLKMAGDIGAEVGFPETIQAIVMQETLAGKWGLGRLGDLGAGVGERSYGVTQVRADTARHVFHTYPNLKAEYFGTRKVREIYTEELVVLLMTDDEAAILIAAKYFEMMIKSSGGKWHRAVAGYNGGWGTASKLKKPKEFAYVKHISRRIRQQIRPFNKRMELQAQQIEAAERYAIVDS